MKIGFVVQGITDKAFLTGIRDRWCADADLILLGFRGSMLRPRQYPGVCAEGRRKGCDVVIILTDSDNSNLNTVYKEEKSHLSADLVHYVIIGVAVRNIECWICADVDYIASRCGCDADSLRVKDPKIPFERIMEITRDDKKESEIANMVRDYPSLKPMLDHASFKRFYDDARDYAQRNGCHMPNEWERGN